MSEQRRAEQPADNMDATINFLLGLSDSEHSADDDRDTFRIGDLSREFDVTLRTLRFYEDRGMLSPERRGTTRLYSRRDRAHLRLILLAKLLGFSLTEAKQLIEIYEQPDGERRQLEVALDRFTEQEDILKAQKRDIEESIQAMHTTVSIVKKKLRSLPANS